MKIYLSFLLSIIMMIACSVGYGKDSPPKNAFFESAVSTVHRATVIEPVTNVIASNVVSIYSSANAAETAISEATAITSKVITAPVPKASQLSKYIHYNSMIFYSIKKVEARARDSDILNQNRRC